MSDSKREKFIDKSEEIVRQGETEDDVIMNFSLRPAYLKSQRDNFYNIPVILDNKNFHKFSFGLALSSS